MLQAASYEDSTTLDFSSILDVLLPLELHKHPPFPSELAFNRISAIIDPSAEVQLTSNLLFSIGSILADVCALPVEKTLICILRKLRRWRLLPQGEEERSGSDLVCLLADIANGRCDDEGHPRFWKIAWIRVDEHAYDGIDKSEKMSITSRVEKLQGGGQHHCDISKPSLEPVNEASRYRNGCCACRQPRLFNASNVRIDAQFNEKFLPGRLLCAPLPTLAIIPPPSEIVSFFDGCHTTWISDSRRPRKMLLASSKSGTLTIIKNGLLPVGSSVMNSQAKKKKRITRSPSETKPKSSSQFCKFVIPTSSRGLSLSSTAYNVSRPAANPVAQI